MTLAHTGDNRMSRSHGGTFQTDLSFVFPPEYVTF